MANYLEKVRRVEIELLMDRFQPGMRVLELGGGNGFQASIMTSYGCSVDSIDLADRDRVGEQHFPVRDYDGEHIPAEAESYDIVFSSNVLEHVRALPAVLAEIHRVLKPEGVAIHIVPSPTWRFWTTVAHYGDLGKRLTGRCHTAPGMVTSSDSPVSTISPRRGLRRVWWALFGKAFAPHGEFKNAVAELYYFRRKHWVDVLRRHGFQVVESMGNACFYTGYTCLPEMSMETRGKLSIILGSSCNVLITRRKSS